MLNRTGVLSVMDRGLTINWEDGPTLHRMTALVHYHTADLAAEQVVRVHAYRLAQSDSTSELESLSAEETSSEANTLSVKEIPGESLVDSLVETLAFVAADAVRVEWIWHAVAQIEDEQDAIDYWTAQLRVTNTTDEIVYLDALDVIRIDSTFSGQFNVGAPPNQWRCATENEHGTVTWETGSISTANAGGFTRAHDLLVKPAQSNRSRPPAVFISVLAEDIAEGKSSIPSPSTEIQLQTTGERFESLVARTIAGGAKLPPAQTFTSAPFLIASGDDPQELCKLALSK